MRSEDQRLPARLGRHDGRNIGRKSMSEKPKREFWTLHVDALCEPNPGGIIAWAWVLRRPGRVPDTGLGSLPCDPEATNNVGEFMGLYFGLRETLKLRKDDVSFYGLLAFTDSQLMANQINGAWAIKKDRLKIAAAKCHELLKELHPWTLEWTPRERNKDADELTRKAYFFRTGHNPPTHFWEKKK